MKKRIGFLKEFMDAYGLTGSTVLMNYRDILEQGTLLYLNDTRKADAMALQMLCSGLNGRGNLHIRAAQIYDSLLRDKSKILRNPVRRPRRTGAGDLRLLSGGPAARSGQGVRSHRRDRQPRRPGSL